MDDTKPITPEEAGKAAYISPIVIECVNQFLRQRYRGYSCIIKQEELIDAVIVAGGPRRDELFEKSMLDFEPLFGEYGWKVEYDKPGLNATYKAFWKFTKARPSA